MREAIQSRAATSVVSPVATKPVGIIAAVVALAQLAASGIGGYWFDEAYMLAIGRHHLDWGSADQPPVTPALAALADWLAPGSLVVLRLPAVLATAAAVVVAALIAREFGGGRRAQTLTALAQATTLWVTMAGHWLTPYSLEPVQWLLLIWLLVRWIRVREDRLLLAMGVVAGVAAETKFQVLLLCGVLLVTAAVFGPRELLRRPLLWAGTGAGFLIALPTLWWQAANGWPQLRMGAVVAAEAATLYGGRPGIAVSLIALAGFAGLAPALYGVWRLLRVAELRDYRFLGVTAVVLYVFFVVTIGRPYYLGGLYGLLIAAGVVGFEQRQAAGGRRARGPWIGYGLGVVTAVGMLVLSIGLVKPDTPRAIADRAVTAYEALPAGERDITAILGQSYIHAAYLDVYAPPGALPTVYSTSRSYGWFPPPPESARHALYLGTAPDELRNHFGSCEEMIDPGTEDTEYTVWMCRDRQDSWQELWPRLRHLDLN